MLLAREMRGLLSSIPGFRLRHLTLQQVTFRSHVPCLDLILQVSGMILLGCMLSWKEKQ